MPRPVRPWFRLYTEAFSDRKVLRLTPVQRWIWVAILGAARESPSAGSLHIAEGVPMTTTELARFADVRETEVRRALPIMASLGMITIEGDAINVTNWGHRQFESDDVTARTQAHRERSNEQDANVPKTVPTNVRRNTPETETEKEKDKRSTSTVVDDSFEEFWKLYPKKVNKKKAQARWKPAVKAADGPDAIIAGLRAYLAMLAMPDNAWLKAKDPEGWLTGERWNDEPSNVRQIRAESKPKPYETPPAPDASSLPW